MAGSSVMVDDFDHGGGVVAPDEADPPLVVDPNAVLASAIVPQRFQPVRRRYAQIIQSKRRIRKHAA
jgi:hypothetical protein